MGRCDSGYIISILQCCLLVSEVVEGNNMVEAYQMNYM